MRGEEGTEIADVVVFLCFCDVMGVIWGVCGAIGVIKSGYDAIGVV